MRTHAKHNWDDTTIDSSTETRTHNSVNELTARTPSGGSQIDLTYDNAGNLTQDGDSDGDHKYTWDYRNRLIEVQEKQSGTWTTIAEYTYDANNRRVVKEVTNKGDLNGTTRFAWGGQSAWQCLEERDGSGSLVARFVYSPGYIDAVARQERDLNADDDFGDSDEVVWYHSNTLYSIYALSDTSENVVERYRYDSYGGATVLDADGSDDSDGLSDVENPYAFTARRQDVESGLMQYRSRFYDVELGRFVARDGKGYVDGLSLYVAYFVPNSLDPYGTDSGAPPFRVSVSDLADLCDKQECVHGCENGCDRQRCREEAAKIVLALENTWNYNYGRGTNISGDNVGGYLCWDWSRAFEGAANTVERKCWLVAEAAMESPTPGDLTVHFYVSFWAHEKINACKVMVDDGWFERDGSMVHRPPWPPWPPTGWRPPADKYTIDPCTHQL
ncbi:MAG: RHS repeat-associated core domain-containing protein [Candidatus Brocadiia bacterium]